MGVLLAGLAVAGLAAAGGSGKVLLIGFFAWLINDWQRLSETLYAGFIELGLTAGGGGLAREDFLNPGAILAQGWSIVRALGETPAPVENPFDVVGNLIDALILSLAMIGIMLAFAVLALQIIVALLEFKIVTLGGFVLLPFGIWSKSAFLAERPLGYVVSAGLKVLALAIVVSGAQSVFDQLQPTANPDIYEALAILVAAILMAMLAVFIPNLASALVSGGPALGAGALAAGGLAVGGAGLLAGAGLVGAGAIASGGAARMAGPTRAAAGAGGGRNPSLASPAPRPPSGNGPKSGPVPDAGSGRGAAAAPPRRPARGPRFTWWRNPPMPGPRRATGRGRQARRRRRSGLYLVDLTSVSVADYDPIIFWKVEETGRPVRVQPGVSGAEASLPSSRYVIEPRGRAPRWTPTAVHDDGRRTTVEFPAELSDGEAPALFEIGPDGERRLVGWRQAGRTYVADRLFERAELRLGVRRPQIVRIRRLEEAGS